MGLLDQFTQAVDARKRYYGNIVRGLLDNPQALMEQLQAQNAENVREQSRSVQDARSVMPGIAEPAKQAAFDEAMNVGLLGLTAYHGSPHSFDKFDMSKIGTGEGAQAYGHGLYFAENPGVAKTYADIAKGAVIVDPDVPPKVAQSVRDALRFTVKSNGSANVDEAQAWLDSAIKNLDDVIQRGDGEKIDNLLRAWHSEAKAAISNGKYKVIKPNLYKVDIPDEAVAKMLDWDKPLSQQPKAVQKYIEKELAVEIAAAKRTAPGWGDLSAPFDPSKEWTGSTILGMMRDSRANILSGSGPAVSAKLNAAGIPGIRYLDGGSRGAGSGTSNFVVFDPEIIKILSRE